MQKVLLHQRDGFTIMVENPIVLETTQRGMYPVRYSDSFVCVCVQNGSEALETPCWLLNTQRININRSSRLKMKKARAVRGGAMCRITEGEIQVIMNIDREWLTTIRKITPFDPILNEVRFSLNVVAGNVTSVFSVDRQNWPEIHRFNGKKYKHDTTSSIRLERLERNGIPIDMESIPRECPDPDPIKFANPSLQCRCDANADQPNRVGNGSSAPSRKDDAVRPAGGKRGRRIKRRRIGPTGQSLKDAIAIDSESDYPTDSPKSITIVKSESRSRTRSRSISISEAETMDMGDILQQSHAINSSQPPSICDAPTSSNPGKMLRLPLRKEEVRSKTASSIGLLPPIENGTSTTVLDTSNGSTRVGSSPGISGSEHGVSHSRMNTNDHTTIATVSSCASDASSSSSPTAVVNVPGPPVTASPKAGQSTASYILQRSKAPAIVKRKSQAKPPNPKPLNVTDPTRKPVPATAPLPSTASNPPWQEVPGSSIPSIYSAGSDAIYALSSDTSPTVEPKGKGKQVVRISRDSTATEGMKAEDNSDSGNGLDSPYRISPSSVPAGSGSPSPTYTALDRDLRLSDTWRRRSIDIIIEAPTEGGTGSSSKEISSIPPSISPASSTSRRSPITTTTTSTPPPHRPSSSAVPSAVNKMSTNITPADRPQQYDFWRNLLGRYPWPEPPNQDPMLVVLDWCRDNIVGNEIHQEWVREAHYLPDDLSLWDRLAVEFPGLLQRSRKGRSAEHSIVTGSTVIPTAPSLPSTSTATDESESDSVIKIIQNTQALVRAHDRPVGTTTSTSSTDVIPQNSIASISRTGSSISSTFTPNSSVPTPNTGRRSWDEVFKEERELLGRMKAERELLGRKRERDSDASKKKKTSTMSSSAPSISDRAVKNDTLAPNSPKL